MSTTLTNKRIALLSTDGFEDSELIKPKDALEEAGATVDVLSDHEGSIKGKNGTEISVDKLLTEATLDDYDGVMLPGGVANPDALRQNTDAISFLQSAHEQSLPIAAICHAPWILIEAGLAKGRTMTSWPSLKTDLLNAGANWVDEEVVQDNGIITSRNPDDIPAFNEQMISAFSADANE